MAPPAFKTPIALFQESTKAVRRNLSLFILFNSVMVLGAAWQIGLDLRDKVHGSGWDQLFVHQFTGTTNHPSLSPWIIGLAILIGLPLYLMGIILEVKAASQKTVDFNDVWRTFLVKWWKILLALVLTILIICVGLVLFIVPGLYLMSRLWLAPYFVVDRDVGVIEAIDQTWKLSKGHAWAVFIAIFFGFLLGITSIVPLIGGIIATALAIAYSVALPIRYFELKKIKHLNA